MNALPDEILNPVIEFLTEVSKWIYFVLFLIVFFVVIGLIISAIINVKRFQKNKKDQGETK